MRSRTGRVRSENAHGSAGWAAVRDGSQGAPRHLGPQPGRAYPLTRLATQIAELQALTAVACPSYPIVLWETDALRRFTSEVRGPVNVARLPQMPSLAELAAAGVARVGWGPFLHLDAMARFSEQLASLHE